MTPPMKKVLIVSPHFAPINAPDMQRTRLALPYLRAFGWEPVVLAVAPDLIEGGVNEPLLEKTFPSDIRVVRVRGLSPRLTRWMGVGSLWLRCGAALRDAGDKLLREERFDLVFFSTTQFEAFKLGPRWKSKYGVPYVLDYQDPWVNDYYERTHTPPPGGRLKFAFSQWSARRNEPGVLRESAGVIAVSGAYGTDLGKRYPWFDGKAVAFLPFGAAQEDFKAAAGHKPSQPLVPFGDGLFHHVYTGRCGPDMSTSLKVVFRAFKTFLASHPAQAERIRFHFIGTDYAPRPFGREWAMPVARLEGVEAYVSEHCYRVPYFDAIHYLVNADALLAVGSNDPTYSASKIFPYVLARRPMLLVFNEKSPVLAIAEELNCGIRFSFRDASEIGTLAEQVARRWFLEGSMTRYVESDLGGVRRVHGRGDDEEACRGIRGRPRKAPDRAVTPGSKTGRRVTVVLSHPTQYYSPWFRWIGEHTDLRLSVLYLWDFGVARTLDPQFGTSFQWDVDLLSGYESSFVPNVSRKPGAEHFFGFNNPAISDRLAASKPDAVILFGYKWATHLRVVFWAWRNRVPILFRGDSHLLGRGGPRFPVRQALRLLYSRFSAFLYVGSANRQYFEAFGVPSRRLFFAPHSVDASLFSPGAENRSAAQALRTQLGIRAGDKVVLFAGKFIPAKQPVELIEAFLALRTPDSVLVFVGDGPEKGKLESLSAHAGAPPVRFLPFANQSEMPSRYLLADLFVLPSRGSYETWGLAVNEAMQMGVPCLVSDRVGCQRDLVTHGRTGWVFTPDEPDGLRRALAEALSALGSPSDRDEIRSAVAARIGGYSYRSTTDGLSAALAALRPEPTIARLLRITIVTGFFLPVPAVSGGATEKIWHGLAKIFVSAGHSVTFISRQWPGLPDTEIADGIVHVRVRGHDHTRFLAVNIFLDFLWGLRVLRALPAADAVVCNTITLPIWLHWAKPAAGRTCVMIGRTPKGQDRLYGGVARIYAPSSFVADQIHSKSAARRVLVVGYPIDWPLLARSASQAGPTVTLGFVGRLHPEKGIDLLIGGRHRACEAHRPSRVATQDRRALQCFPGWCRRRMGGAASGAGRTRHPGTD